MDANLSNAITELDRATDALLDVNPSDLTLLIGALERRAEAVEKVTWFAQRNAPDTREVEQMRAAFVRGAAAARALLAARRAPGDQALTCRRLLQGLDGFKTDRPHCIDHSA